MDIRRFLKPKDGGGKASATETLKSKTPPTAKGKGGRQTTPRSAASPPSKPKTSIEDDEVEIIPDSDDDGASGTAGGAKRSGKKTSRVDAKKKTEDTTTKKGNAEVGKAKDVSSKAEGSSRRGKSQTGNEESSSWQPSSSKRKKKIQVFDSDEEGEGESPFQGGKAVGRKRNSLSSGEDSSKGAKFSKHAKDVEHEAPLKRKKTVILDSDSDGEDPLPKKKRRSRKMETGICIDSDGEQPHKTGSMDMFVTHNAPRTKPAPKPTRKSEGKTTVMAADFFGGATVHRTERNTCASKRKVAETVDQEMHDDDDFAHTLAQLDQQQSKKPRQPTTPTKESKQTEEGSSSLASKLSQKMKTSSPVASSPSRHAATRPDSPSTRRVSPRKSVSNGKSEGNVEDGEKAEKSSPVKGTAKPSPAAKKTPVKTPTKSENRKSPRKSNGKSRFRAEIVIERKTPRKPSPVKEKPASAEKKTPPKADVKKDQAGKGSANRNWGGYRSFLNREGPRALGSKEIPTGEENCLEGLTFVITGILESMERDEAKSLVERYGGKVTGNVSTRTSYLVLGRDPGVSKVNKAEQCRTQQLDEDGLLELIRTRPGKKSKYQEQAEKAVKKEESIGKTSGGGSKFTALKDVSPTLDEDLETKERLSGAGDTGCGDVAGGNTLLWVDKHKPKSLKQIIGQQGDKSNARKLLQWIQRWHKNRAAGVKPSGRFYGNDDGSGHKAALLSGPPGIGKTTTAVLVCKEAGFSTVELNASDQRSKRSLKEVVAEALNNQTLVDYMGPHQGPVTGHTHCLIMDEVDGMAGNEDRGGLQELIHLIKGTRIPIVCICNDRNAQKMRTLANYCFDLRFQRPRLEQIKGALMSIAYKEGLKISPPAMQEIIMASNQDIRQCIHNISMWTATSKELSYDQAKQDGKKAEKDVRMGIFDVSRKVFAGGEETAKMTINDKSDLFFQDYSFVPLFVHENYPSVTPYAAKADRTRHLSLLAKTADSISVGDQVDRKVRASGQWNLLPIQAMFASVIPGEYMRGGISQMIQFPAWLGKNSTTTKHDRILQELRSHMALKVSSDKRGLNMDYLPALRRQLTNPLARRGSEGVPEVIAMMDDYDIVKDDYDNILDISKWPNSLDPLAHLDSRTKAAFTRQYNKESHMTPYATQSKKKRGRGGGAAAEEDYGIEAEGEAPGSEDEKDDGIEADSMIKTSKKGGKAAAGSSSKGKADSDKGKGPAKGKGQAKGKGRR